MVSETDATIQNENGGLTVKDSRRVYSFSSHPLDWRAMGCGVTVDIDISYAFL